MWRASEPILPKSLSLMILGWAALLASGCPLTTKYPSLGPENPAAARQRSQQYDPFPDKHLGPDADFRPREFLEPRAEPHLAKSRSYLNWLRLQAQPAPAGSPAPDSAPLLPPGSSLPPQGSYPPPAWGTSLGPAVPATTNTPALPAF